MITVRGKLPLQSLHLFVGQEYLGVLSSIYCRDVSSALCFSARVCHVSSSTGIAWPKLKTKNSPKILYTGYLDNIIIKNIIKQEFSPLQVSSQIMKLIRSIFYFIVLYKLISDVTR